MPEHGYSDDSVHRRMFPDRRCSVATAACRGIVTKSFGPAFLCSAHQMAWGDHEAAGREERLRAWVRNERESGKVVGVEPRRTP